MANFYFIMITSADRWKNLIFAEENVSIEFNRMVESFHLNGILRQILEIFYRRMPFLNDAIRCNIYFILLQEIFVKCKRNCEPPYLFIVIVTFSKEFCIGL